MEGTAENSSQLPAYTALSWREFVANPHLLYNLCPGLSNRREDNVVDMTDSNKLNNWEFKVESIEELERLRNDLLTKPILFHAEMLYNKSGMTVKKLYTDEFAVLVNTKHPGIRKVLTKKLQKITQHMQEGKKFCLKLSFNKPMQKWYSGAVDSFDTSLCPSDGSSACCMLIKIYNYTTPVDCCMSPLCIVGCFPFWLLCGGPCYYIHRTRKYIDDFHNFRDLPVVPLIGVSARVTVRKNLPPP